MFLRLPEGPGPFNLPSLVGIKDFIDADIFSFLVPLVLCTSTLYTTCVCVMNVLHTHHWRLRIECLKGTYSVSVPLKAIPSFPVCAFDTRKKARPVPDSWAARDVSFAQGTLEISLLGRISKGWIGLAYSARVISATANGSDITDTLPESVCLNSPSHGTLAVSHATPGSTNN